MRKHLHRLYLGCHLFYIKGQICDSPFIIINGIQTDLLLEHVQAYLVKERKMTLGIT